MLRLVSRYGPLIFYKQNFSYRVCKFETATSFRYKSHYHTLELNSSATAKEIKTAYYKLSLQYHPDKSDGSQDSVAKFREITEAYETLSNPEKKKKYDKEYIFQPQYSSWKYENAKHYKSTSSQTPHTGKTKDFNYDEHFKQHYENIQKQREAEFEYFRRRWESDFYRRYPTAEHYYRNRYKYRDEEISELLLKQRLARRRAFLILGAVWTFIFIFSSINEWGNPDKRHPIYYHHTKSEKNEDATNNNSKSDL